MRDLLRTGHGRCTALAPAEGLPIVAFVRRAGDRTLVFRVDEATPPGLVDAETGSRWRLADGEAIEGPLKGQRLARAPAYRALWFGCVGYFRPRSSGRGSNPRKPLRFA